MELNSNSSLVLNEHYDLFLGILIEPHFLTGILSKN